MQPPAPETLGGKEQASQRVWSARLGFLADTYDFFAIDLVIVILVFVYGEEVFDVYAKSRIASAMLVGVIIGQLTFGYIADWIGRRWTFLMTAALTIVGAIGSSIVTADASISLPMQLCICRFVLGLGVGGEYPLTASVAAEATTDTDTRRLLLASVIGMQGFGMLGCSCVAMTTLAMGIPLQNAWRIILGFGAVPSSVAFCFRCFLQESTEFEQAKKLSNSAGETGGFSLRKLCMPLLGTCLPWFLFNIFQYSIGTFKSSLLIDIFPTGKYPPTTAVFHQAGFAGIISIFAIAGFGVGILAFPHASNVSLQMFGFTCLIGVFCAASFAVDHFHGQVMVLLLGLMFFFVNCGPNLGTYIIPAEVFPTLVRARCHGISAACGKMGAVLGTATIMPLQAAIGMPNMFLIAAFTAFLGVVATHAFTPRAPVLLDSDEAGASKTATAYGTLA